MGPVETEFNPADYPPEYITVGVADPLPSILDRVEDAWVRTPNAVLVIPRGSQAFHSTHDFLALGKLQDSREVRVSIASPDPIIIGLARLLGFYVVDPPPGHPVLLEDPASGVNDDNNNIEQPTAPLPLGTSLGHAASSTPEPEAGWVFVPSSPGAAPSTTTSTWLNNPADYIDPALQPRIQQYNPPVHRPGIPPPRTRTRQTGQLPSAIITDSSLPLVRPAEERQPDVTTSTGRLKARRLVPEGRAYQNSRSIRYGVPLGSVRWRRSMLVVSILLLVALLGSSVYAYAYLPVGTISVAPVSQAITNLPVEVGVLVSPDAAQPSGTARDAQPRQTINAALISSPLSEEGTRPATGTRQVPRGKAQGMITFTNRTGSPVSVPAGAQFKAANGVIVQTAQAGTVPGTNFTAQSFGTLSLPIIATVEGPDGNIPAGQLSGTYGGTLSYTNSALQGGSLDTLKVVKQEDVDGLVAELQAKLNGEAAGAVMGALGAGQQIITQTISVQDVSMDADHKAGEDGDSVRVKLTGNAQAYIFKDADMQSAIVATVRNYVNDTYPDEVSPTLSSSVDFASPALSRVDKDDKGKITRIAYSTAANTRVAFALTPRLATEIQDLVKGKNVGQARTLILSQTYSSYLKPDSIEARLLWFTINTLPNDPARINVQPSGAATQQPGDTHHSDSP